MSDMLGRSRPYDITRGHCCRKHGGPEDMGAKRRHEERAWRADAQAELHDTPGDWWW